MKNPKRFRNNYHKILFAVFVLALIITPPLWAFRFLSFEKHFYQIQFQKTGVYDRYEKNFADQKLSELLEYLKKEKPLSKDVWSKREIRHMNDVKDIYDKGIILLLSCTAMLILSAAALLNYDKLLILRGVLISGCVTLALIVFMLLLPFEGFFDYFHKVLFSPGTYAFSPSTSLMKSLLPNQLFENFLRTWGVLAILIALLELLVYAITARNSLFKNLD